MGNGERGREWVNVAVQYIVPKFRGIRLSFSYAQGFFGWGIQTKHSKNGISLPVMSEASAGNDRAAEGLIHFEMSSL